MIENRAKHHSIGMETTLLLHGVPRDRGRTLAVELASIARAAGANPCYIGIVNGKPIVGMTDEELGVLFDAPKVAKANTSNIGSLMHRKEHAATTVSTTMELCAEGSVRVFATGGLGGVHRGYAEHFDVSADLAAFTRFGVAVVTSGVKSILDVVATREALETLGVCVVGFGCDRFPAFYTRESEARVDARFDDIEELAGFVRSELRRTKRGIVIANPIPKDYEIDTKTFAAWLEQAQLQAAAKQIGGRDVTPFVLGRLHELSGGETLEANIALIKNNTLVGSRLAAALAKIG